jgi:hypothetical protein
MMRARWLLFRWSSDLQEMAVDGETFAHPIATQTSPSHDLAHLLAAASGLPWKPRGTRDDLCFAEFNAVLLEHLGVYIFDAVLLGRGNSQTAHVRALAHARWFALEHYAPFPVDFDSALARFRACLDSSVVVRLSPMFFRLRAFELSHHDFRAHTYSARFCSTFVPDVDAVSSEPQRLLASQLEALLGERGARPCA